MRKNLGSRPLSYPQPVFIIASYNPDGSADAMNAAWAGISEHNMVSLCLSANHRTVKNILDRKAFTISMGQAQYVKACDYVGLVSGNFMLPINSSVRVFMPRNQTSSMHRSSKSLP